MLKHRYLFPYYFAGGISVVLICYFNYIKLSSLLRYWWIKDVIKSVFPALLKAFLHGFDFEGTLHDPHLLFVLVFSWSWLRQSLSLHLIPSYFLGVVALFLQANILFVASVWISWVALISWWSLLVERFLASPRRCRVVASQRRVVLFDGFGWLACGMASLGTYGAFLELRLELFHRTIFLLETIHFISMQNPKNIPNFKLSFSCQKSLHKYVISIN